MKKIGSLDLLTCDLSHIPSGRDGRDLGLVGGVELWGGRQRDITVAR